MTPEEAWEKKECPMSINKSLDRIEKETKEIRQKVDEETGLHLKRPNKFNIDEKELERKRKEFKELKKTHGYGNSFDIMMYSCCSRTFDDFCTYSDWRYCFLDCDKKFIPRKFFIFTEEEYYFYLKVLDDSTEKEVQKEVQEAYKKGICNKMHSCSRVRKGGIE